MEELKRQDFAGRVIFLAFDNFFNGVYHGSDVLAKRENEDKNT